MKMMMKRLLITSRGFSDNGFRYVANSNKMPNFDP